MITHAPYWPTLTEQVKLAEATPVLVRTSPEDGFAIRSQPILDAITPRTRGIIINSPCNPTGALISEDELAAIAQEAARRGIWVIIDLCYEKLIYDRTPHNLPAVLHRHCRDLAVICGSASKAYAMTGWRCGWTLAPAAVIAAQNALQSHATSNVSSITQKAVIAALTGSQEPVVAMLNEYRTATRHAARMAHRRSAAALPEAGGRVLPVRRHQRHAVGRRLRARRPISREALLDEARVAVTPGEAFDAPGFVRISYATSMENLREGSTRMLEFVDKHASTAARVEPLRIG